jgi:hypothetical protein
MINLMGEYYFIQDYSKRDSSFNWLRTWRDYKGLWALEGQLGLEFAQKITF